MNKNICIITSNSLPVPAVKGGAVETLVNNLIIENEKSKLFNFHIISIYDKKALDESKKYTNTNFKYIKILLNKTIDKLEKEFTKNSIIHKVIKKVARLMNYRYTEKVYKYLKKNNYDYIIIEGGDPYVYKKSLKYLGKNKCIFHIHGNAEGEKTLDNYYGNFIAISKFVKDNFIKNNIINPSKVHVIENCIDLNKFDKTLSDSERKLERKKYGIDENDIVIMFCGRTVPEKGVKELIQAFKKLNNIEKCKLLIVGNSKFGNSVQTEYDKELIEETKEIKDKVKFTGYIHNNELYKIYGISDISAIPSIWDEPSGLVVIEAMASKLPIVTTNSGGIPELVDDKCAYIIERDKNLVENLGKALDELISKEELRKTMGQNGKINSEKYSNSRYYNEFTEFINSI